MKRILLIIVCLSNLSIFCFGNEMKNGLSFNLLGLITTDVSQYPLGFEFTYVRKLEYGYWELIGEYDYSLQNNFRSNTFYIEPRFRTNNLLNKELPIGELYLSAGIFGGLGIQNNEVEPMFGIDGNIGLLKNITDIIYADCSVGIQYPDYPLTRSYRIHYLIPEVNYICLRSSLGVGIWF